MMFSTNRLVGAVVYHTRKALNADPAFMKAVEKYVFAPDCLYDGVFHLWHFPGTHNEISAVMHQFSKSLETSRKKFPCVMNFQPVVETLSKSGQGANLVQVSLNLAICAVTDSEWKTQTREREVFDTVLGPIYEEFMRQLTRLPYTQHGHGLPVHRKVNIFTTGANSGQIHDRYNEHIDAIEIVNLVLTINPALCDRNKTQMSEESDSVLIEFN